MTIQEIRIKSTDELKESKLKDFPDQLRTVSLDVDLILSHVLQKDRTWILFHRNDEISSSEIEKIISCIEKRKTGLPIAYITNHKEFFGLDFYVDENVLIPKPDTELLVEQTVNEIKLSSEKSPSICDMCSGSGCVGISVAKELSDLNLDFSMTFGDISQKALEITKKNAEKIFSSNPSFEKTFSFVNTDLFEKIDSKFNVIVTNPPYVPHEESVSLLLDGRSEPLLALDGGENDGLEIIRRLVPQCFSHLEEKGILLMETGEYNAEETAVLFKEAGFKNIRIEKDMNGMLRDVIGYKI